MNLIYDQQTEVTKNQYDILMNKFSGVCAGREENGKFFIKLWMFSYRNEVAKVLKNVQ